MKVVITGGTGFIGRMLARAILERGTLTGPSGNQEEVDAITLFDAFEPPAPRAVRECCAPSGPSWHPWRGLCSWPPSC